jgi:hypothetical protein
MATSININQTYEILNDKKLLGPPKNLKNEITKFNKKLNEKKKLSQTITKSIIDTNLGINANNTQRLIYKDNKTNTMINFPTTLKKVASFPSRNNLNQTENIVATAEVARPKQLRHHSNEPSVIHDKR